ncbi:MAG: hypothetical protein IKY52_11985 [Clostridia bacterium]|nr:hypothetical protein [Clostridia bacterium]
MAKRFLKNNRPLVFALGAMVFLCAVLLVLYFFAREENTLLKTARSEQFLALAAGEAEAALAAWETGSPTAVVYHRITSAAAYLTMAAPTEYSREMAEKLRTAGELLLQGEILPADTTEILQTAAYGGYEKPEHGKAGDDGMPAGENTPQPWAEMPSVSRREGLKLAETMTQTGRTLHPAYGKNLVYTCRNVYVRLSHKGGVPLEMAVYTPAVHAPSYPEEACEFRSGRFLEQFLPRSLGTSSAADAEKTEFLYRFRYPWSGGQIQVDVRKDTGRIVGFQMLTEEKEQSLSAEKDCSYI